MNYVLYDSTERVNFYPLTLTRPISDLKVGFFTIRQKWEHQLNSKIECLAEDYLAKKYGSPTYAENVYVDARILPSSKVTLQIKNLKIDEALEYNNRIVAFHSSSLKFGEAEHLTPNDFKKIYPLEETFVIEKNPHIIEYFKKELLNDIEWLKQNKKFSSLSASVQAIEPDQIFLEEGAKAEACIINASTGPVYIAKDAEIMEGSMIRGPIALGSHSAIKMGAKIYGPVSIGEHCKVGGEVSDSIIHAYSNKGHDGFLGHSYLGEWCNIGADTNNSNLKNGYQKVKLWNYATERFEQSGMQFLGLIMGDHSKTAINTTINTGTTVGVACNIYGAGFPRNFTPSFTEGGAQGLKEANLNATFRTADAMMQRRKLSLNDEEKAILKECFIRTAKYRNFK